MTHDCGVCPLREGLNGGREERQAQCNAAAFLRRAGYPAPEDWRAALAHLRRRFGEEPCPHEVGVFLAIRSRTWPPFSAGGSDRSAHSNS
ncbi:hypothetical protein JCM30471_25440 [Desulfuromonas carbonis]|uniref:DUF3793 family protein n=1 Tax=Desulfuromonas sp. DDH964 TaxID=1823759 RepID=UPI000A61FDCB